MQLAAVKRFLNPLKNLNQKNLQIEKIRSFDQKYLSTFQSRSVENCQKKQCSALSDHYGLDKGEAEGSHIGTVIASPRPEGK